MEIMAVTPVMSDEQASNARHYCCQSNIRHGNRHILLPRKSPVDELSTGLQVYLAGLLLIDQNEKSTRRPISRGILGSYSKLRV
jgi:hypothetical protein